jgi:pilus assembly protein Flp/PilA
LDFGALDAATQASAGKYDRRRGGKSPLELFPTLRSSRAARAAERRKPEDSMKSLAKKLQRFLISEDGPTAVEYAVMLALIIIVCLTAINSLGTNARTTFTNVANSIGS